jgi:hypothetical protein
VDRAHRPVSVACSVLLHWSCPHRSRRSLSDLGGRLHPGPELCNCGTEAEKMTVYKHLEFYLKKKKKKKKKIKKKKRHNHDRGYS